MAFQNALSTFLTTYSGVHTGYTFNNTEANIGTDTSQTANSSSYSQADTDNYPDYALAADCAPDVNLGLDIYIITDCCMLLYIPSNLATGVYGLFWNGGGTNAQGAFIRSESTGTTITLAIQHNTSPGNDYITHTITERGWVCLGFQFEDNSGNMAIWVNGVNVAESARSYSLAYGSGNPGIGDNNGDDIPGWGAESNINGSGLLIACFTADNPDNDNSSPAGLGDSFYEDYYDAMYVTAAPDLEPNIFDITGATENNQMMMDCNIRI